MTTRPELIDIDRSVLPGLLAVVLFGVMAATFLAADFTEVAGFPEGVSIVSGIGYALIGAVGEAGTEAIYQNTENFLVALILIAILLDAALDGALMLAKRDEGGEEE